MSSEYQENDQKKLQPVVQYCVSDVLYENSRQPIRLGGCVVKINVAKFYGPFTLYDDKDRVLAKSVDGSIIFHRDNLQTEETRVWYDSIAGYSLQYKRLKEHIKEPGLCFDHIPSVFIEFEDAPSIEKEPDRKFTDVHIIYTVNNLWNKESKRLVFG